MSQTVKFVPSKLSGTVQIPPSKSELHRAIICAMLSKGTSKIRPIILSEDIKATIDCATVLGAECRICGDTLYINSANVGKIQGQITVNCRESGSTLRFFIPIVWALGISATFVGSGRLPNRPLNVYKDTLARGDAECESNGGLPFKIKGRLRSGKYEVCGNISSQFITGLLLALPLADGDSQIMLTTPLESVGYVDMTIAVMKSFGVNIQRTDNGYFIKGNQQYLPQNYTVEGDWSQTAFFLCAGAIANAVSVGGVFANSLQGDRAITDILTQIGARLNHTDDAVTAATNKLNCIEVDASQIPDLVPVLAVTCALCKGTTIIKNCGRLRLKESDRIKSTVNAINMIGGNATEDGDTIIINGVEKFTGSGDNIVDGCNDHRILMSMAVAAVGSAGDIIVSDAMSIRKSYPNFYEDYNSLGGNANVCDLGE